MPTHLPVSPAPPRTQDLAHHDMLLPEKPIFANWELLS
jgi:hypothetical protein